eukprot:4692865-Prymnesium_polylepis.2
MADEHGRHECRQRQRGQREQQEQREDTNQCSTAERRASRNAEKMKPRHKMMTPTMPSAVARRRGRSAAACTHAREEAHST